MKLESVLPVCLALVTLVLAVNQRKNLNFKQTSRPSSITFSVEAQRQPQADQDRIPETFEQLEPRETAITDRSSSFRSRMSPMGTVNREDSRKHPGDTFPCDACVCSYSHERDTIANCTNRQISNFPNKLPHDTKQVMLSGTRIRQFYMVDLLLYPSLSKLMASGNRKLIKLDNSSVENRTVSLMDLDLSSNNISQIDDGCFKMMTILQTLNLGYNALEIIHTRTFEGTIHLQKLNLSKNVIKHIDQDAFDSLTELRTLDLSRNRPLGYYDKVLPPRLFQNLKNLQELDIHGFTDVGEKYPVKVLQQLTNLQKLSVNGLHSGVQFGPEMRALKRLTYLGLIATYSTKCALSFINDSFFENLQNITSLKLHHCNNLKHIGLYNSTLISTLRTLVIQYSHGYGLYTALSDLRSFQNTLVKSLGLIGLSEAVQGSLCRSLRQEHAKYLKSLMLEELDLSYNRLVLVANDFLKELPRTLKRLILTGNKLSALGGIDLNQIGFLIELDVSIQNRNDDLVFAERENEERQRHIQSLELENDAFQTGDQHMLDKSKLLESRRPKSHPGSSASSGNVEFSYDGSHDSINSSFVSYQRPSPSSHKFVINPEASSQLQIIRASHFNTFGLLVFKKGLKALKEVDFSNSFITILESRKISPRIEIADLSNNYLKAIGKNIFTPNSSLIFLSLRNNLLGPAFADDYHGHIFANLGNVKHLDVSTNTIENLPNKIFIGLQRLQTLKLSENKLQILNISMSHLTSLTFLDLSKNFITLITKETREDLEKIAASHNLDVDLTDNTVPCTCEGLELLHWMATTVVYFLHKDFLTCRLKNGKIDKIGNLEERVRSLQRECASQALIIVICVATIAVLGIVFGFALMYRFRWKLRYLKNIALARVAGFKPRKKADDIRFKFDAFVIYGDSCADFITRHCLEELEVKRGHKLCLEDRNFIPGTFIVSDIISAIQNSTKTVVVVTPDLYEGEYSEYSVKMAVMEEIHTRRSVLHLCVYQPMPDDEISQCTDLLMVMKRNDYTEFPPENEADEEIRQNFWDQLSQAIGHTGNDEERPLLEPL